MCTDLGADLDFSKLIVALIGFLLMPPIYNMHIHFFINLVEVYADGRFTA